MKVTTKFRWSNSFPQPSPLPPPRDKDVHRMDTEAENMGWGGSWSGMDTQSLWLKPLPVHDGLSKHEAWASQAFCWMNRRGRYRFNNSVQGHTTKIMFMGACGPLEESVILLNKIFKKSILNLKYANNFAFKGIRGTMGCQVGHMFLKTL